MNTLPLTPELLVTAYQQGIFPMDVEGQLQWFCPDPRAIFDLSAFHISKSLRRCIRSGRFEVRFDTCFEAMMRACGDRPEGTWISDEIVDAYTALHRAGLAHSVECWCEGQLAGGVYGVSLGGAFFGESMFHRKTNASKVALAALVERMRERGMTLFDVQFLTPHLASLGAEEISRARYLDRLRSALELPVRFAE